MTLLAALLAVQALLIGLGAAALSARARAVLPIYAICAILTGAAGLGGVAALIGAETASLSLPIGLPWLGSHWRLDPLSAVFLAVVGFGACAASLYAIGYGRHEHAPERVLPFYPVFLAAMQLVVLADDAFSFLLSWELMSLISWALVVADHEQEDNRFAGVVYLVMASLGTLSLLLAFGLLAGAEGAYSFAAIRSLGPPANAGLVVVLVLIGAGSKAGLVPLHVWLPLAHPAAPSHVSALMSGVMTKVAIYGLMRIVLDLLGPPATWWSVVALIVGAATAVIGLLYAIVEEDLKRLLAYSTVENIGIVLVGIGLALAFKAAGMGAAAALAATATLLHVINHAAFKSLLFFGAGAVLAATGERRLDGLGGLIRAMPRTSFAFLIGAAAIAALPPLNGFVSEWLIFQAILVSPDLGDWGLRFLIPAVGALLALAAALAAACFVRAFGLVFLGRPRSPAAAAAREVDRFSTGSMLALAGFCLLAGVLPGLIVDAVAPAVRLVTGGAAMPAQTSQPWLTLIPLSESRSSYNGLVILMFIAFSAWTVTWVVHRFASHALRRAPAWDCGFPDPRPVTQYSASSFAQPLRRVFGPFAYALRERVRMPPPGSLEPAELNVRTRDIVWDALYRPVTTVVGRAADRLNRLQFLTIRRYLGLVFGALVLLLMVVAAWH